MKQRRWTLAEFERWLRSGRAVIYIQPFRIVACACKDVNCHGWRLVSSK